MLWQLFGLFLFAAAIPIMNSCALIRLMRWTICEDNSQHNLFTRVFLDRTLNHWPTDVVVVVALSPKSLSFSQISIRQLRPRTSLLRFCDTGGWSTAQCHSKLNCVILIFKWGNRSEWKLLLFVLLDQHGKRQNHLFLNIYSSRSHTWKARSWFFNWNFKCFCN